MFKEQDPNCVLVALCLSWRKKWKPLVSVLPVNPPPPLPPSLQHAFSDRSKGVLKLTFHLHKILISILLFSCAITYRYSFLIYQWGRRLRANQKKSFHLTQEGCVISTQKFWLNGKHPRRLNVWQLIPSLTSKRVQGREKHVLVGCKHDMFWHQTFQVSNYWIGPRNYLSRCTGHSSWHLLSNCPAIAAL